MIIKKKMFWIIGIIGIIVFILLRWKDGKNTMPEFKEIEVERGNIQVTILATGVVEPQNRLEIKPSISGRIEEILVQEGQLVKKGEIMAWMSSTERAALLDAARAKGAEELAHWEDLYKPTPIFAPLNGVVISKDIEPGQTVTNQDVVVVLSDRLIISAQVDETDIGQIQLGQETEIIIDAYPQYILQGCVAHIAYEAETINNVTIYQIEVAPDSVPSFMKSGMTANVIFFVASKKDVFILPSEAIRQYNGQTSVLIPNLENKKHPFSKEIEIGLTDGKKTEIISGLEEGEVVLVVQMQSLRSSNMPARNPFVPFGRRRK